MQRRRRVMSKKSTSVPRHSGLSINTLASLDEAMRRQQAVKDRLVFLILGNWPPRAGERILWQATPAQYDGDGALRMLVLPFYMFIRKKGQGIGIGGSVYCRNGSFLAVSAVRR